MPTGLLSSPLAMIAAGVLGVFTLFILKSMFKSSNSMFGMLIVFAVLIGAAIMFIMSLDPIDSPGMSAAIMASASFDERAIALPAGVGEGFVEHHRPHASHLFLRR